ncbi:hypothetical protein Taro_035410 [Colocasia esculenta]|uniref:Uncharacterized protein n=1 Tax=Colocasia esculenta TaxID=4460 RepID=A0A843W5N6_COLES|nr:hypothetical protein [Colocasia esculenta]
MCGFLVFWGGGTGGCSGRTEGLHSREPGRHRGAWRACMPLSFFYSCCMGEQGQGAPGDLGRQRECAWAMGPFVSNACMCVRLRWRGAILDQRGSRWSASLSAPYFNGGSFDCSQALGRFIPCRLVLEVTAVPGELFRHACVSLFGAVSP